MQIIPDDLVNDCLSILLHQENGMPTDTILLEFSDDIHENVLFTAGQIGMTYEETWSEVFDLVACCTEEGV